MVPPLTAAGGFPPALKALMDSVVRDGSSSTEPLITALSPLVTERGMTPQQAAALGFGRFPVQGPATYSHDWWMPRFGPGWRLHEGTDIFAPYGTPVRAPSDGILRITNGGLGGLSSYVVADDRTYFYMTHLSGHPPGLVDGQRVVLGQEVGYLGNSGNAASTPPHLHIEIHPGGGPPVDPKAHLDGWLKEAIVASGPLLAQYGLTPPAPATVADADARASADHRAGVREDHLGPAGQATAMRYPTDPVGRLRLGAVLLPLALAVGALALLVQPGMGGVGRPAPAWLAVPRRRHGLWGPNDRRRPPVPRR